MAQSSTYQNAKEGILLLEDGMSDDKKVTELFNRLNEKDKMAFIHYASCSLKEQSTPSFALETPAGAGQ